MEAKVPRLIRLVIGNRGAQRYWLLMPHPRRPALHLSTTLVHPHYRTGETEKKLKKFDGQSVAVLPRLLVD
jgi:hypothetical protein